MAFGSHHHFDCILANMTDWRTLAAALDAPLSPDDGAVIETLERLERSLRELSRDLPLAAGLWSGPGELE